MTVGLLTKAARKKAARKFTPPKTGQAGGVGSTSRSDINDFNRKRDYDNDDYDFNRRPDNDKSNAFGKGSNNGKDSSWSGYGTGATMGMVGMSALSTVGTATKGAAVIGTVGALSDAASSTSSALPSGEEVKSGMDYLLYFLFAVLLMFLVGGVMMIAINSS